MSLAHEDSYLRPDWLHKLAWLVRLRWLAAVSQALTVLVADRFMDLALSLAPLYAIVAATACSNLACLAWLKRAPQVHEWMLAALMALDFVLLTALLELSGGASNPFTVLFLVNIALGAVVLRPRFAWALTIMSIACFGLLFILPAHEGAMNQAMAMHQHAGHHAGMHASEPTPELTLHLQGMWVAFAIAAAVITYFVTRVTRDLEAQRSEVSLARTRALRNEKLASLATLAAGAAHELASPLATIAVVAKELERELSQSAGTPTSAHASAQENAADARLIRDEVERCKRILEHMAIDAGESAGEAFATLEVAALLAGATEGVLERERIELSVHTSALLQVPARALGGALRGLVRNALSASSQAVRLSARQQGEDVLIEISDRGAGMAPELLKRVGEPFFTTKSAGEGMGLGVFLARTLCERLGGTLELRSAPGEGTEVRVLLPQAKAHSYEPRSDP